MSEKETTAPPVAIPEFEIHEVANLLPMITGAPWKEFVASVQRDGITSEIVLTPDGKTIIDGRNRYKACQELGIRPLTRKFGSRPTDGNSIAGFIIRENLERRQLTDSQRAIAGAKLSKLGRGKKSKDGSELTQADIIALLNISGATLSRAKRANDKATKAIRIMMEEKQISVSVGAVLAGLPEEEQNKLAMEGAVACRKKAISIMQPAKSGDKDLQQKQAAKMAKRAQKAEQAAAEKARKAKMKANKEEADKLLGKITDLVGDGKHLEAIELCRKALELSPGHGKVLKQKDKSQNILAKQASAQKKLDEAKAKQAEKAKQTEFGASTLPATEHQTAATANKAVALSGLLPRLAVMNVLDKLVRLEYTDGKLVKGGEVIDRCLRAIKNIPEAN